MTANALKWTAPFAPPAIGSTVRANFNNLGEAKVTGYFEQEGYLGVVCWPMNPPEFWRKQNPAGTPYRLFGTEIDPVETAAATMAT